MEIKYTDPIVTLENVDFAYQQQSTTVQTLRDISLAIHKNEFICIVGPSGCGKSTLLKLIAGFIQPTAGACKMYGEVIKKPDASRGVVFQAPTLYPWLTVQKNIEYGLKIRKEAKDVISRQSQRLIEKVHLTGFEEAHVFELSGGMRQRVALARTLINQPDLILMDEPFSALDAITRMSMQQLVRKIWGENNQTIFFITHDIEEALKLGTRIIVLSKNFGQVVFEKKINYSLQVLNNQDYLIEEDSQFHEDKHFLLNLIEQEIANEFFS